MFGFALPYDTDLGGLNIGGYGVGDVPRVLIGAASGDTNLTGQAAIHFLVFEQFPGGNGDAYLGRTMFGFDNDFTHDFNGRWAFQLFESHGGYTGGFPDSVAFAGVNTGVTPDAGKPYAILHALNPTTLNDDLPKTNIVSLFEGRADQVGDLTQWKLTGGSTLLSIPKSGGIASFATDTAVPIAVTGWTNTFGKNAVVYVNGTAATYTIQNNASTLVRTNSIAVGNTSTAILQPNGKLVITGGSAISGSAVPF
jgi:hypothetical protein